MFGTYAQDTVTVSMATKDKWGATSATATRTIQCRIERRTRLTTDRGGRQVASTGQLLLASDQTPPTHSDTVTVDGATRTIIGVAERRDFTIRGWEVFLV